MIYSLILTYRALGGSGIVSGVFPGRAGSSGKSSGFLSGSGSLGGVSRGGLIPGGFGGPG
jgi:hypothetical protein